MTCSNKSVYTKENYETKISSTQSSSGMEIEFYLCRTNKESATTNAKIDLMNYQRTSTH